MNILMIDNYDSFTYNLVQYLGTLGAALSVFRNDKIDLDGIRALNPDGIVISPGPGIPDNAGITLAVIREFSGIYPILGVCLGHQAIGQAYGGRVVGAPKLMHGKVSQISHFDDGLFRGLENPFTATRYHSLMVEEAGLPEVLEITARSEDGLIMGLAHRELPVVGVQFHPESFLTDGGQALLGNFLEQYVNQ